MAIVPFVRRELLALARRRSFFWDRAFFMIFSLVTLTILVVAWDWWEWDRASVSGALRLGLVSFGIVMGVQLVIALGAIPGEVSPAIAQERDKKTLDALLATRLTAAEIVLGKLSAGLVTHAAGSLVLLPVLVLVVVLGGIDPWLLAMALLGVTSTAFALSALSMAVTVGSRTARRSQSTTLMLGLSWLWLPAVLAIFLPRLWPAGAAWITPVALWLDDSSPMAVVLNLIGLIRRASLPGAVLRMIALQTVGSVVLLLVAVGRLRPASRAVYDSEGRSAWLRSIRRRWIRRPPCGDDPVLWNQLHSTRGATLFELLLSRLISAASIGLLIYVTSWFAIPAFEELADYGYGAAAGKVAMPELNPFVRILLVKTGKLVGAIGALSPGQARLEFNLFLRVTTAVLLFMNVLIIAGTAAECVTTEKERDTWLGLIATPLDGLEILRAMAIGSVWRARGVLLPLVGLWVVGFLAGAIHPLGILAALVVLITSMWLAVAGGLHASMWAVDRKVATGHVLPWALLIPMSGMAPLLVPQGHARVWMGIGSPPFLVWVSLCSYEDVAILRNAGHLPMLDAWNISTPHSGWSILATLAGGLSAQIIAAAFLTRGALRDFDRAVGRPRRPSESILPPPTHALTSPLLMAATSARHAPEPGSPE